VPNNSFTVTVIDQWPKIKLLIMREGNVREEGPYQYDVALSQFTPAINDSLRLAVEQIIRKRKGE
jgi:hypothetical protein